MSDTLKKRTLAIVARLRNCTVVDDPRAAVQITALWDQLEVLIDELGHDKQPPSIMSASKAVNYGDGNL